MDDQNPTPEQPPMQPEPEQPSEDGSAVAKVRSSLLAVEVMQGITLAVVLVVVGLLYATIAQSSLGL